jgi:hypothetical protein
MRPSVGQVNAEANRLAAPREGRTFRRNRAHALWAPVVLLELYLAFTVFIFFFGPVEWHAPSAAKLLVFLVVNYSGLWFGYSWGIRRGKTALTHSKVGDVGVIRMPPQLMWVIIFSMGFTIISDMVRLYAIRGDMGTFVSSFLNPGEAYRKSQELAQMDREGGVMALANFSWAFRISTVLAVFNGLYFPLALVCWRRMSIAYRVMFFVTLFCAIQFTVGLGAQSGIGVLVFASLPVVLYKIYVIARPITGRPTSRIVAAKKRGSNPALAKMLVVASLCVLVATVVFFQLDRAEESGRELNAVNEMGGQYASPSEHGIVPVTGGRLNFGLVMACNYVSHGYEGLALSMELPFEWTYGLGWSKALQVILHDYLGGPDLFERSYLMRNSQENEWPNAWWSTIFPWIASDTTYYGTVLFMVLVGFLIARCWVNVIFTGNPIGFAVLAQMFTLVFMFPANNALAQTLEGFFSLIGVISIYAGSWKYFSPARTSHRRGYASGSTFEPSVGM